MSIEMMALLLLDSIFINLTVPTGHLLEEKWELVKKLKYYLDFPVTTKILDILQRLEEMELEREKPISKAMKEAYLQVAVQLTLDIVRSRRDTIDALGKIAGVWGERMQHLKADAATSEARLGSEGLRAWFGKINDVVKSFTTDDAELSATVESYFEDVEAKASLICYVFEELCDIRSEVSLVSATETSRGEHILILLTRFFFVFIFIFYH